MLGLVVPSLNMLLLVFQAATLQPSNKKSRETLRAARSSPADVDQIFSYASSGSRRRKRRAIS